MKRKLDGLSREKFDVIVVGGGVIGTGVARDAAMRGLKTLLLEKEDFGYGTTSRSTRLIHGGLRYLSHLDFKLVRQDLKEREILLRIAPYLVQPLGFLLPMTSLSQRITMAAGMRLYDILSWDKGVPSYRYFSRSQTLEIEPQLEIEGLTGSYQFYDCQVSFPERLAVANALCATARGAWVVNHAEVVGFSKTGDGVQGVRIKDVLSREVCDVTGRIVVSVVGHWANGILKMALDHPKNGVRTTLGVHLVTPKISNSAMVLFARSDGRLIFVIPWHGYSLIGTTDTEYSGDLDTVHGEFGDVAYLVNEVRRAFPGLTIKDVFYAFAGLRSLVGSAGEKVSNISRSHRLVDHEVSDGVGGLLSILGGKMTGYRSIAAEAVDLACKKLGSEARCTTATVSLPGSPGILPEEQRQIAVEHGLSPETVAHLNALYGSNLERVVDLLREEERGKQAICPHTNDILAQVWHAVNEESATTLNDFMLRRGTVGLASCRGLDAVETVALEMGRLLRWSVGEWQEQVRAYRSFVELTTQFREHTVTDHP